MIGILQNHKLNMKEVETWHLSAVRLLLKKISERPDCKRKLRGIQNCLGNLSLDELVLAPLDKLKELSRSLPREKLNGYVLKSGKRREHLFCKLYSDYRQKYGAELVKRLHLTVCPYCNRNFINGYKSITAAQFDHFLCKDDYPVFALSLYNLIPCCPTCNHWKGKMKIPVSPYDVRTTDELIRFDYHPIKDGYEVDTEAVDEEMKRNIEVFHLGERYALHSDLVEELITKHKYYCESNLLFLEKLMRESGLDDRMDARELLYGNYLTEDKYYLRPLSKFTHDILDQLQSLR